MNFFIVSLGSNLGDSATNIANARTSLESLFGASFSSSLYRSSAVELIDQPDFYNQALAFEITTSTPAPEELLQLLLTLETTLGRKRTVRFGPRVIDIDLIFYSDKTFSSDKLTLPHPRFLQRSFVVRPMLELPIKKWLTDNFNLPEHFDTEAYIVD
ncbi:MAG: 2-amino-4-hydroxy-6-hydroxymethyldihydropteridine diphosphokinase [Halobacteriovorax sp.]|nr:2-amino-4-hydroxy-6-hydroxymethyldihydropteridine diphosphokinase [Halobacteriovorax sp.]